MSLVVVLTALIAVLCSLALLCGVAAVLMLVVVWLDTRRQQGRE